MLLLLAVGILVLGGCGGSSSSSSGGGGGATSAEITGGNKTAPAQISNATINLTPSRDSGVNGTATFLNGNGEVQVDLKVRNLPDDPGTEHPAHIHQGGTCADDRAGNEAPIQYPLNPVITQEDGTGTSTTTIEGTQVVELFSGTPRYVNVHAEKRGESSPPGISCADLPLGKP